MNYTYINKKCLINSLIQASTARPWRDLNTSTQLIPSPKLGLTLFYCSLHQRVRAFFHCQFDHHIFCCHGGFLCFCHSICNPLTSIEKKHGYQVIQSTNTKYSKWDLNQCTLLLVRLVGSAQTYKTIYVCMFLAA